MLVVHLAIGLLVIASSAYAFAIAWGVMRVVRDVPMLRDAPLLDATRCPRVSVLVPACNEGDTIAAATEKRLALDYPDLQFVYVDDRSTDDTGALLDGFAARDERVRVIHVTALPAGWIGKVHAMSRAVDASDGEWVLLTDADVHLEPDTLRRAMGYAFEHQLDHLAVFPSVDSRGLLIDSALAAFSKVGLVGGRIWRAADPSSPLAVGVGAFNLMRRSALERSGGLDPLRLEVSDDVGIAQRLKAHGARTAVLLGTDLTHLMFYPTLSAMARGAEKSALIFKFSAPALIASMAFITALELTPFLAPFAPLAFPLRALAAVAALVATAASYTLQRRLDHPRLPALLVPLGALMMLYAMTRGGLTACLRKALIWRGTRYPASELIPAQNTRFY